MPDIAWVSENSGSGVTQQARVISRHFDNVELFNSEPIEGDFDGAYMKDSSGLNWPTEHLSEAIIEYDPDITVLHTLNPSARESISDIEPHSITMARLGANFKEQSLAGSKYVREIPQVVDALHAMDHIIASSFRAKHEIKCYGIRDNRITTVPTTISTDALREPEPKNEHNVGLIGRVGFIKNQITVLEAMGGIQQFDDEISPEVRIAGHQNGPLLEHLSDILAQMSPNFKVDYYEYVEDPVNNFFPPLKVHCHPSWTENCPQTLLEAAIAGVPSIVSDSAWADVYPEAKFPRCNPDDPFEWSQQIHEVLTNEEYRMTLANQQQEAIVENYSAEQIMPRYEELFESMMDEFSAFKISSEVRV